MSSFSDGVGAADSAPAVYFIFALVRFMIDNHCAEIDCNIKHEWLLDDKYKNWVSSIEVRY